MQLGVGKTLFPSWTASITLVKDHGRSAIDHAASAVRAGDGSARLDHAVRAMTSFDHAIDNTRKLPVEWFVRRAPVYYRGYEAARQAVNLLVGSGLIPGARERVGRQTLLAARDAFVAGVDATRTERGRFATHLASGWLEATAEDAVLGVQFLQSGETGRALLSGINQVRGAVLRRQQLDDALVRSVTQLFDRANQELTAIETRASRQPVALVDPSAFHRSGELLAQAAGAAQLLVDDAQRAADELPVAG